MAPNNKHCVSNCCKAACGTTSYSTEGKSKHKADHPFCQKCGKPCELVDKKGQVLIMDAIWSE